MPHGPLSPHLAALQRFGRNSQGRGTYTAPQVRRVWGDTHTAERLPPSAYNHRARWGHEGQHLGRAPSRAEDPRDWTEAGPRGSSVTWRAAGELRTPKPTSHGTASRVEPASAARKVTNERQVQVCRKPLVRTHHFTCNSLVCEITNTDAVIKIMARHFLFSLIRKIGPTFLGGQTPVGPAPGQTPRLAGQDP